MAAAEFFVSPSGSDSSDGLQREAAFATIQRGVDALEPGDTLTILPGQYHESVRRDGLGSDASDTVIRAEVPGTAILRGDVPIDGFQKVPGSRFTHVADFDGAMEVHSVIETDTLRVLEIKPNSAELEFAAGAFYQDRENGKLYLSTTDSAPATAHTYTAAVRGTHGIYLHQPRRVTIDGLMVAGFHATGPVSHREGTLDGIFGIFLNEPSRCVLRNCSAFLNGHGIGLNMHANERDATGDNVVEACAAWGNSSQFGAGDMGGISLFSPRRDAVRNSVSFLNRGYGINIYGGQQSGAEEANRAVLSGNLAWGNMCDFKIKAGHEYVHTVERCVGPGLWSVRQESTGNCLIGNPGSNAPDSTNIVLAQFPDMDWNLEFADPENMDFRLQATSRLRGLGPDGSDPGPFPYQPNVFFLSVNGDDRGDGLSLQTAWASLQHAAKVLQPGDTLYLLPGSHEGGVEIRAAEGGAPITILGRGRAAVNVRGAIANSGPVRIDRVTFQSGPAAFLPDGPTAWPQLPAPLPAGSDSLALILPPEVHSLTPTTANLEWITTRPARAEIAWGDTPECANRQTFTADTFATFSLHDLEPGKTYYFRLEALADPEEIIDLLLDRSTVRGRIEVETKTIRFTTPEQPDSPRIYYVAPDGNDTNPGLDEQRPWRTLGHAAGKANAGDTVLVAPGTYPETVRIRATGTPNAPIVFQARPGGKTILNGSNFFLHQGFVANSKSHLRFDGFTFTGFNMVQHSIGPWPALNGEFVLLGGRDIRITRCFADGRGGYPAHFIRALDVRDLTVKNCVMLNKMSGAILLVRCPDFVMRHCVIASPMIGAMVVDNLPGQRVTLENNIFTDMLKKKSDFNFDLLAVESGESVRMANNGFLVRSFPPAERNIFGLVNHAARESTPMSMAAFEQKFGPTGTFFGDPVFAGVAEVAADPDNSDKYLPDLLLVPDRDLYFADYLATAPDYVNRSIGLQPAAFAHPMAQERPGNAKD